MYKIAIARCWVVPTLAVSQTPVIQMDEYVMHKLGCTLGCNRQLNEI